MNARSSIVFLVLVLGLVLPGCLATAGDLETIANQAAASESKILQALEDVEAGVTPAPDMAAIVTEAFGDTALAIGQVREDIEARATATLDPLLEQGGVSALLVALGMGALNWHRNRTRKTDPAVSNLARNSA